MNMKISVTLFVCFYHSVFLHALRIPVKHELLESKCREQKEVVRKLYDSWTLAEEKCSILPDVPLKFAHRNGTHEFTQEETWNTWHHSFYQNDFRLQQAMHKLMNGNSEFAVVVLGGSITAGSGCAAKNNWVSELTKMLNSTYGSRVKVTNLAKGGSNSWHVLGSWNSHYYKEVFSAADLVISEYQYNEMFGLSKNTITHVNGKLLDLVMGLPKKPAFLFLDLPGPPLHRGLLGEPRLGNFHAVEQSRHYAVAKQFQVPLIWITDLERQMGHSLNWNSEQTYHPDCTAHTVFAKAVHDVLRQTMTRVCEKGVQGKDTQLPDMKNEVWKNCVKNPGLDAHASEGAKKFPVKSAGQWVFQEDVPGKPGWIAPSGSPTEIVFKDIKMQVGGLTFDYLQTYQDAGSIKCALEKEQKKVKSITLNGLWQECASLEMTSQFFDIPAGTYDLRCQSDGGKFKLTGLQSC